MEGGTDLIDFVNKEKFWKSSIPKDITITFIDGDIIDNTGLESESMEIREAICSDRNLVFGSCNATEIRFTTHNVTRPKTGQTFTVSMVVDNDTAHPLALGTYKVASDVPTADRSKREITGYDALYDIINADVAAWYNALFANTASVTVSAMRASLAAHFNLQTETQTLVNDSVTVTKTIDPKTLSGRDVLAAIGEITGTFPHITRAGKLKYVSLDPNMGALYPSNTLYPSDNLFPKASAGQSISKAWYIPPLKYEDYTVNKITGVVVRTETEDVGTTVGTTANAYIVNGNFLLFGKTAAELAPIATALFNAIKDISYRPYECNCIGNPCLEVGDIVRMATKAVRVDSYILQRTLTGINSLKDNYIAEGNKNRPSEINSISSQFTSLEGKYTKVQADTDGLKVVVGDEGSGLVHDLSVTANNLSSEITRATAAEGTLGTRITQTETDISTEVTRASAAEGSLSSRVTQNANSISSEVTRATGAENAINGTLTTYGSRITQTEADITAEVTRASTAEGNLSTRVTQNANGISAEVTRATGAESTLSGRITVTSDAISAEVSRAQGAEGSLSSSISAVAGEVSAKVSQTGGSASSFGWSLLSSAFKLMSNSETVFQCDSSGIEVNGRVKSSGQYGFANIAEGRIFCAPISGYETQNISISSGDTSANPEVYIRKGNATARLTQNSLIFSGSGSGVQAQNISVGLAVLTAQSTTLLANNSVVLTESNYSSYVTSVAYASSAHEADQASFANIAGELYDYAKTPKHLDAQGTTGPYTLSLQTVTINGHDYVIYAYQKP